MSRDQLTVEGHIPEALSIPIGEVVGAWRRFRNLSLTELAEKTQLPKGYISQVEHKKIKRPKDANLARLASALGIEVWDLLARNMPNGDSSEREDNQASKISDSSPAPNRFNSGLVSTAGILSSSGAIGQEQKEPKKITFGEEIEMILAEANLPYGTRQEARRLILEVARIICQVKSQEPR